MRKIFGLIFFFGIIYGINASGNKSITIYHIGNTDRIWDTVIINTQNDGFLLGYHDGKLGQFYFYYARDTLFDEIITFINNNDELYEELIIDGEYNQSFINGWYCFEITVNIEGEKNNYYLLNNNSPIIFFEKLIDVIIQYNQRRIRNIIGEIEIRDDGLTIKLKSLLNRIRN